MLTANDHCAFHAIRVCRSLELRIPNDISLIGFDDIPFSMHTDVPLTTVRVDKEAMGRLAVRRLHARMQAEVADNCPCVCNLLPVSLVVRQSCRVVIDTQYAVTYSK